VSKAQQVHAALSPDDGKDYAKLKKAILLCYDINEESYCQHLKQLPKKKEKLIVSCLQGYRTWLISRHKGVDLVQRSNCAGEIGEYPS